jgi:hypothetical protein
MGSIIKQVKRIPVLWRKFKRYWKYRKYKYQVKENKDMKINIIYSESGWILYKFAKCVYDELTKMGINASLSEKFDKTADINHYFVANYADTVDNATTFMITHVDTARKIAQIKEETEKGGIGICMSLETRNRLIANGIKANKLCYINPAQDGQIRPKKVSLGFTHRVYNDSRKRESMLIDICKQINPNIFRFVIMGSGWEGIISQLNELGFETEYYPEFDKEKYNELMVNLDYYCYFGFDEGSMGYLDAVAAGIGTIVTPQGYHLDTECEITYPVSTIDEIVDALHDIERKKEKNLRFIETWTWKNYALKHLEVWRYMLGADDLSSILCTRGWYTDGIYSLLLNGLDTAKPIKDVITSKTKKGSEK